MTGVLQQAFNKLIYRAHLSNKGLVGGVRDAGFLLMAVAQSY